MNRPKCIILCGIPGSGKTTYAKKYIKKHENTIHLSSDKIREELWGNESTQGDNNEVFSLMQKRAIEALNNGQNVVYDATNITRKDRGYIISRCPQFVKIEAHVVWAPIETCLNRDAERERTVGREVIDRMLKRFQAPFIDEGIDKIKVIIPKSFDRTEYINNCINIMDIPHDNPHHTLDVLAHCNQAAEYLRTTYNIDTSDEESTNVDILAAALYHDMGKPYTKSFVDAKGNPCDTAHYYQHHCLSSYMYYGIGPKHPEVAWLISTHMEPFFDSKYYKNLPAYLKNKIDLLHEADVAAH